MSDIASLRSVPEGSSPSLYTSSSASASTSTFNLATASTKTTRKASSIRTLGRQSNDQLGASLTPTGLVASSSASSTSMKRTASVQSTSTVGGGPSTPVLPSVPVSTGVGGGTSRSSSSRHHHDRAASSHPSSQHSGSSPRYRTNPRIPHDKDAEIAPPTLMHWSRAPVWGTMPNKPRRGHSVTLVDTTAWVFGGSEDKDTFKDMFCFDIETMQWTHPETVGDPPPATSAHSSTLYDRRLVVYGGGLGPAYYDHVYIFDTTSRRWSRPQIHPGPKPPSRRAHSAVCYRGKIWIFGGGNGLMALGDLWTLDLTGGWNRPLRWEQVEVVGSTKPTPRGYHTANLVNNTMVVMGGSDGKDYYTDVWLLNLDTLQWHNVRPSVPSYRRLAHTATQVGSYLFIFGGHSLSEYESDLVLYNLVTLSYESRPIKGKTPPGRGYHASILADSRLFVFGGFNGSTYFDDVWILDLAAGAYLPQVMSFVMDPGVE